MFSLLLFAAASESYVLLDDSANATVIEPISRKDEIAISCGIELGLILIAVICYFAFRKSLIRNPDDPRKFTDEKTIEEERPTQDDQSTHEVVQLEQVEEI